jgi:hypothetical protein
MSLSGGIIVNDTGVSIVTGGVTIASDGLQITRGGMTILSGGLNIADSLTLYGSFNHVGPSDVRLKKNIQTIQNPLVKISQLR